MFDARLFRLGGHLAFKLHVRICANKVVACVRCSTLLPTIRLQDTRQFTSAQQISQLEGLAVAIPWGFESPLPHFTPARSFNAGGRPQATSRPPTWQTASLDVLTIDFRDSAWRRERTNPPGER